MTDLLFLKMMLNPRHTIQAMMPYTVTIALTAITTTPVSVLMDTGVPSGGTPSAGTQHNLWLY